jgi:hypothetical protein
VSAGPRCRIRTADLQVRHLPGLKARPTYAWPRALGVLALAFVALLAPALRGQQQSTPHAGYVYPAGGRQGTTVRVKVGGQFLDGASGVLTSGRGVRATVAGVDKPLTAQQITSLRDRMQELQKNAADPATQKQLLALRDQLGDSLRRNASPVLSEIVTLDVAIAADAEPGARSLRLTTPLGLSNPLVFVVGQLPEFQEKDVKNSAADLETPITLPATVNGRVVPGDADRVRFPLRQAPQYMPGDVDRYRFSARKGQRLVVAVSARDLMPYLADAVPGWFQATVALLDAEGNELAYDDDYRFHPDPVLHCQIPGDGEYVVEIKDALYRGREDFVYRIAIGELPFVTSVFPLGGPAGRKTIVDVLGWNLPSAKLTTDGRDAVPGTTSVAVRAGGLVSNRVPFAVDTLPEVIEREANDTVKSAQAVTLPVIVNGRVQVPGDWDVFTFNGRAGDAIVAEVTARRLDSPLDSVLELLDAAGHRLAWNDDHDDRRAGLITHQADSLITATLPASGPYFVRLGDTQHHGGAEYAYRLRISAPRPDFAVRVSPSSLNASGGTAVPLTVTAIRRDGFAGDIALSLADAPAGYALSGGLLPAGQDQVRVTLSVPPVVPGPGGGGAVEPASPHVEARGVIQGKTVVRQAAPADEMMQAFAYRHLVPADDLRVSVTGRGGIRMPVRIVSPQTARIPAGGTLRVRVVLPPAYLAFDKIAFELSDPPQGLTIGDVTVGPAGAEFLLVADAAKLTPGLRGNLIVTLSGERVPPATAPAARRRVVLGTLPALPFEVSAGR